MPVIDRTEVPITEFTLSNTRLSDKVSKNFSVAELVRSETALRRRIPNWFASDKELQNAVYLCRTILQKLRDNFGAITPNSVYRSQALERALKGRTIRWVSKSQHTKGQAVDLEIPWVSNFDLASWIVKNLKTDQVILECYDPDIPGSGWVHVSLTDGVNRGEVLSYIASGGKYIYVKGLVADNG